jgi:hypothetical protein
MGDPPRVEDMATMSDLDAYKKGGSMTDNAVRQGSKEELMSLSRSSIKKSIHELKCWPAYFQRVIDGRKPFEVRKNDRDFQCGDMVFLREWNPETGEYTGREAQFLITYILHGGQLGIEPGYCVMTLGLWL